MAGQVGLSLVRERKRSGLGQALGMIVQSRVVAVFCAVGSLGETMTSGHSKRDTLVKRCVPGIMKDDLIVAAHG